MGYVEGHEPNQSQVWVERLAPWWTIPERIETNRKASSEVGVWIRVELAGRCEHVLQDHLLELTLWVLLLLQVHSDAGVTCPVRTGFSEEAEGTAKRED